MSSISISWETAPLTELDVSGKGLDAAAAGLVLGSPSPTVVPPYLFSSTCDHARPQRGSLAASERSVCDHASRRDTPAPRLLLFQTAS